MFTGAVRIANPSRSCRCQYGERDRTVRAASRVGYTRNVQASYKFGEKRASARSDGMAKVSARKANESFVPDFDDPRIRAEFWLVRSLRKHGKGTHRQAGDVVPGFGLDYPLRCALG